MSVDGRVLFVPPSGNRQRSRSRSRNSITPTEGAESEQSLLYDEQVDHNTEVPQEVVDEVALNSCYFCQKYLGVQDRRVAVPRLRIVPPAYLCSFCWVLFNLASIVSTWSTSHPFFRAIKGLVQQALEVAWQLETAVYLRPPDQ